MDPEDFCKRCGCCSATWIDCWQCGGEGHTEPGDLYDEDPLWYGPNDTEPCHICFGTCGWRGCLGDCDNEGKHVARAEVAT
jgi:hypothetical protein